MFSGEQMEIAVKLTLEDNDDVEYPLNRWVNNFTDWLSAHCPGLHELLERITICVNNKIWPVWSEYGSSIKLGHCSLHVLFTCRYVKQNADYEDTEIGFIPIIMKSRELTYEMAVLTGIDVPQSSHTNSPSGLDWLEVS